MFLHPAILILAGLIVTGVPLLPAWTIAEDLHKSVDSQAFSIIYKFPKLLLGLFLIYALPKLFKWGRWRFRPRDLLVGALFTVPCATLLMGPALWTHHVRWDFQIPPYALYWGMGNLLLVCFGEEIFFRGYLQTALLRLFKRYPSGQAWAFQLTALGFGLSHWRGGWVLVALSTLAGGFYGMAYWRGGLVAAIITHFLTNLIHFLFFSYPSL
jgi:membrane protease YdiL (CAAX protease family)